MKHYSYNNTIPFTCIGMNRLLIDRIELMENPAKTKLWIRRVVILSLILMIIFTAAILVSLGNPKSYVTAEVLEAYERNGQIVFQVRIKNETSAPVTLNEIETWDGKVIQAPGCQLSLGAGSGFVGTLNRPSKFTAEPGQVIESHIVFSKSRQPQPGEVPPQVHANFGPTIEIHLHPNRKVPFITRFAREACLPNSKFKLPMLWIARCNYDLYSWLVDSESTRIQIPIDDWINKTLSAQQNAIELKQSNEPSD
jgi:hypothetical protein